MMTNKLCAQLYFFQLANNNKSLYKLGLNPMTVNVPVMERLAMNLLSSLPSGSFDGHFICKVLVRVQKKEISMV